MCRAYDVFADGKLEVNREGNWTRCASLSWRVCARVGVVTLVVEIGLPSGSIALAENRGHMGAAPAECLEKGSRSRDGGNGISVPTAEHGVPLKQRPNPMQHGGIATIARAATCDEPGVPRVVDARLFYLEATLFLTRMMHHHHAVPDFGR